MTVNRIGVSGLGLNLAYQGFNELALTAGGVYVIPSGGYFVTPGPYTFVQATDPITGKWRSIAQTPNTGRFVQSDGVNVRLANLTGCALGAFITNEGSGYTSAPAVAASAGSSSWTAIVGGAVSGTVTITAAGTSYAYPPVLTIAAPPAGGVQATAICTISAGAINAVTVIDQGAGYTAIPIITVTNDPRDTAGSGGVLTAALTGSGTITALLCTGHGTAVTAVPTLTFTGGGGSAAAATAVMCFTATGFTVGTAGAGYGNAQPFGIVLAGGKVSGTASATVNPTMDRNLLTPRLGNISGTTTAGGAVTATGALVNDGGLFSAVPSGLPLAGGSGLATTQAQVTVTVGGVTDVSILQPF